MAVEEDVVKIAIAKGISDKMVKEAIKNVAMQGKTFNIDAVVHINGTITQGEDFDRRNVAKAKPWAMFAVLLEEYKRVCAAAKVTGIDIVKVVEMADKVDPKKMEKAEDEANELIAKIKESTTSRQNGVIKTDLNFEFQKVEVK